jgi:phenylacetate-CoA ligase
MRVLAASVRGYQLRARRYGPDTEQLVVEAMEREQWPAERWRAWQEDQLARLLHHAATRVPYYRAQWEARRRSGDDSSVECIENWPLLHKEPLRATPQAFVADNYNIRKLISEHTSGTTGTPLTLWMTRDTVRAWYALFEARWRRWYGVSRRDRWAIVGGQLVSPVAQSTPPFWVWNQGMNQLYLSSYHLSPGNIPHYLTALQDHQVVYLYGYASSLFALARGALESEGHILSLKVIISNAEPLFAHQRELIEEAFQCPVYDTYGMSELVSGASECASGSLHLWPEAGVTEIMELGQDEPVHAGCSGRIIGTGLLNPAMPLIRYEMGDSGALAPSTITCNCGRTLPILQDVEGRLDDVIVTPDGRTVGRMDPVFKADFPIREAQIIQESLQQIRVKIVPAPDFAKTHADALVERIQERVGDIQVGVELVDSIPRSANGKFSAVISRMH